MLLDLMPDHPWTRTQDCKDWFAEHGVEISDTYHVSIDTEAMTATIYQFDRNEQGKFYTVDTPTGRQAAKREPFTVAIKRVPVI